MAKPKVVCKNCGQPTSFGEMAEIRRVDLGWCPACYKQSQRSFTSAATGDKRWHDELMTVDGLKGPFSPH
jgi:protein-arginine kinase activator protein McsA